MGAGRVVGDRQQSGHKGFRFGFQKFCGHFIYVRFALSLLKVKGRQVTDSWIQTDEAEDVAGSLRHVIRVAEYVEKDAQAWKWVVLALHSALQGACVCHLTTAAVPIGAVTERNAVEWSNYFEELRTNPNAKLPKTYLMALPDLLKAVRKPLSAGDGRNSAGIAISDAEFDWLKRFHDSVRNQFTHFKPMGWSVEVSGIPDIATLISRIIGEILEMGWAFRHQDVAQREELKCSLSKLTGPIWPS